VYCAVGIRGNFGLVYLKLLGYTNVRNIRGGFGAWADAPACPSPSSTEPRTRCS
jgi:rhodanese-related sulfurtransferase